MRKHTGWIFFKAVSLRLTTGVFLFVGITCKDDPVTPPTNPLGLVAVDATSTEAFLTLSLAGNKTYRTVTLSRGDSTVATITLAGEDSLVVDSGLLPNHTYGYTLTRPAAPNAPEWRVTAQVTTMDTTSHNFTWQIDTLGDNGGYSSVLYD